MEKARRQRKVEELDYRRSGQTEVFLKWLREYNVVFIAMQDGNELDRAFLVPNDKAHDAFEHPFAYMPPEPLDYGLEQLPAELRWNRKKCSRKGTPSFWLFGAQMLFSTPIKNTSLNFTSRPQYNWAA